MSEVKIYTLVMGEKEILNFKHGEEMRLGQFVKYKDYAALEAKCAALAAENAGMSARTPVAYSYRYAGCETCEGFQDWRWELSKEKPPEWMLETGKVKNLVELFELPETTATDAFLAEVRASELDSLAGIAETMLVKLSNQQCSSDMREVVGWKMVLQQASKRAANIRKGGEQNDNHKTTSRRNHIAH